MTESVDPFAVVDLSTPIKSAAEKLGWTRERAIAHGRALGEEEALRRNESPDWAESRIKRRNGVRRVGVRRVSAR